jgi:hypothetical protein
MVGVTGSIPVAPTTLPDPRDPGFHDRDRTYLIAPHARRGALSRLPLFLIRMILAFATGIELV